MSDSLALASETLMRGSAALTPSLGAMKTRALVSGSVAPTGEDSFRSKYSPGSLVVSLIRSTVTTFVISPGVNVSVWVGRAA